MQLEINKKTQLNVMASKKGAMLYFFQIIT